LEISVDVKVEEKTNCLCPLSVCMACGRVLNFQKHNKRISISSSTRSPMPGRFSHSNSGDEPYSLQRTRTAY